jgi:prepilin-type N-terminal cleavage/methylation domain-containing protein
MKIKHSTKGFTLLEILLVVGIIALLAGIVIVAINPARQLASVRNAERKSDIKQIDSAITQYYIDNFRYPTGITSTLKGICDTGSTPSPSGVTCTNLVDLSVLVPDYITAIPTDPTSTTTNTGYYIKQDSATRKIGVQADLAELDQDIVVGMVASSTGGDGGTPPDITSTLGDGLIAHYKMNDADCATVEDSAGNYDGSGTCTALQAGATADTGTAMSFSGSSDNVVIPNNSIFQTSPLAIAFWMKTTASGFDVVMGNNPPGNGSGWLFYINGNKLVVFNSADGSNALESTSDINDNQWHHIIYYIASSGGTNRLYVDGSEEAVSTAASDLFTNSSDTYLGYSAAGYGSYYAGDLDDVRFYSRALTEDEILELAAGTEAE